MKNTSEDHNQVVIAQSGRLEARIFNAGCANHLAMWLSQNPYELFLTSSTLPFPCLKSDVEDFYDSHFKKESHEFFTVHDSISKQHVGHFEIKNISSAFRAGTLGHVLLGDRDYRRKGFGKSFVELMAKVGFEYLNLYRLGLAVHVCNSNAVAAYIRGGFVVEGVIRDVLEKDHKRYSLYQMSLLRPEWDPKI